MLHEIKGLYFLRPQIDDVNGAKATAISDSVLELFLAVCIPYINVKAKMTSAKYLWLNHFPQSSPPPRGPSGSQVQSTFLNCCHLMEHLDLASLPAKSKEAVGKNETTAWA